MIIIKQLGEKGARQHEFINGRLYQTNPVASFQRIVSLEGKEISKVSSLYFGEALAT